MALWKTVCFLEKAKPRVLQPDSFKIPQTSRRNRSQKSRLDVIHPSQGWMSGKQTLWWKTLREGITSTYTIFYVLAKWLVYNRWIWARKASPLLTVPVVQLWGLLGHFPNREVRKNFPRVLSRVLAGILQQTRTQRAQRTVPLSQPFAQTIPVSGATRHQLCRQTSGTEQNSSLFARISINP